MTIPYSEDRCLAFTGEDTATGKSWETWMAKKIQSDARKWIAAAAADAKARVICSRRPSGAEENFLTRRALILLRSINDFSSLP